MQNQRWAEAIGDWTDVKVQNLTLAFPLKSRHVSDVINVLSEMYCRLRGLGLPLHRVHTDRAREFTSRQLAQWFRQRDVAHTTSAGDESQGCARVEAEVGYLKSRTRLLLGSAKACQGRIVSLAVGTSTCRRTTVSKPDVSPGDQTSTVGAIWNSGDGSNQTVATCAGEGQVGASDAAGDSVWPRALDVLYQSWLLHLLPRSVGEIYRGGEVCKPATGHSTRGSGMW